MFYLQCNVAGAAYRLLTPITRRHCIPQHLVSRASPNSLAASRSLILSTTTAPRTRAYSSSVYAFPVPQTTTRWGMFDGTRLRRSGFVPPTNGAHAAFTGLFCIRRLFSQITRDVDLGHVRIDNLTRYLRDIQEMK
jgi:hypothetical protein